MTTARNLSARGKWGLTLWRAWNSPRKRHARKGSDPFCHGLLWVAVVFVGIGTVTAHAQQNLPRPIVLYRSPSNNQPSRTPSSAAIRPVTSIHTPATPGVSTAPARPVTIGPVKTGPTAATGNAVNLSGSQPAAMTGSNPQNSAGQSQADQHQEKAEQTPQQEWEEQQKRPTNQMLQNPSGAQNLSHAGFSNSQQYAPNNYLGPQFQNWSNQRNVGQMPASFGEMNRFQPTGFGGYVAPNTYVGSGFSSWNNLSQGSASPGATGSWSFSVWP